MKYKTILATIISASVIYFLSSEFLDSDNNIHPLTKSWEKAIPFQEVPKGLVSLSSKDCGACHQDHYNEWKLSTHSLAWVDLQFQAELKKDSSPFMCINCHIPLENQQKYLIKGLVNGDIYKPVREENQKFNKKLQQEGINCASCHVRNNTIIGTSESTRAPHEVVKNTSFLSEKLCISCHNASAVITPTLACSFETGDEWKAGPYYGKENCISCHMEETQREIVKGFGARKSRFHYFAGSGIPKFDSVKTMIKNGLGIYPSKLKKRYSLKDSIRYTLKVKNEFAGHKVPTGDPERFFTITFIVKNDEGLLLEKKEERIGEHWQWYPTVKKLSDNNLFPLEERNFHFSFLSKMRGRRHLSVVVKKHRLSQKSADYNKLGKHYPLFITIFEKEYTFLVGK